VPLGRLLTRRRALVLLATLLVLVVGAVGYAAVRPDPGPKLPAPGRAFCTAAHAYDAKLAKKPSIGTQIELVQRIVDAAPDDVAADARVFLDALERRRDGDTTVVDNPRIERAVDHVNRRAAQGCGLYQSGDPMAGI
jgi:hypothetical protein